MARGVKKGQFFGTRMVGPPGVGKGTTKGLFVERDPLRDLKRSAESAYAHALASGAPRAAKIFKHAADQIILHNNPEFFSAIGQMNKIPVTIDEFVEGKEFLGGVEFDIWPALREDLRQMNPDVLIGETPCHMAFLGGATGTGKTVMGQGTNAYQIYLTSCFDRPQQLFGLTPMTPIVFMLQAVSPTVTKRVIYEPFRTMLTNMPYFQRWMRWNKVKESVLEFENNVHLVPAAASLQALLGQAIAGSLQDEVNFMSIVENSKQVAGPQGLGGHFDQAEVVFSNIERRRARSFTTKGVSIGCLCVSSSTRYKNDFLDRKIDEMEAIARTEEQTDPNYKRTFVAFRHKQYEVNPRFANGGYTTFRLLVGTSEYGSRVLAHNEKEGVTYPMGAMVLDIPTPYKTQFQKNPDDALRDVVGIATDALTPFFRKRHKITDAFARGDYLKRWTPKDSYELAVDGMPEWDIDQLPKNPRVKERPHFAHIDLSKNNDPTGIGIIRFDGLENQSNDANPGVIEVLPKFSVVAAIQLKPDVMHEIDIAEVRGFVLNLLQHGINLVSLTLDGYQSQETIQAARKAGLYSDLEPVTTEASEDFREALYQDRVDIEPHCDALRFEMNTAEWYADKKIVDHPPLGTKDVLDGVTGAHAAAMKNRIIRTAIELRDDNQERIQAPRVRVREVQRKLKVERPRSVSRA